MALPGLALLLVAVLFVLPQLASASLPDPTWITGLYDDADDDQALQRVFAADWALHSPPAVTAGCRVAVGALVPVAAPGVPARAAVTAHIRAPPAA